MFELFTEIISIYIQIIERFARLLFGDAIFKIDVWPFSPGLGSSSENSYSTTLKKLDAAKQHMTEAVQALDALRGEYSEESTRLDGLISSVQEKKREYDQTKESLAETRGLLAKDQSALREALGINDRRSKIVGFVSGVFASLLATVLWFSVPYLFNWSLKLYAWAIK